MPVKQRALYTLFAALVLSAYLFLGALLFIAIEGGHRERTPRIVAIEEIIHDLERLQLFLDNSTSFETEEQSGPVILEHVTDLASELLQLEKSEQIPWDLTTGFHFCLTAVTTIGYGYLTPVTQLGRAVTIPYILIGIPLNIFLSANLGYFVAHAIVVFHRKVVRVYQLMCFSGGSAGNTKRANNGPGVVPTAAPHGGVEQVGESRVLTVIMPEQAPATSYTNSSFCGAETEDNHGRASHDSTDPQYTESSFSATPQQSNAKSSEHQSATLPSGDETNPEPGDDVGFHMCPFWFVFLLLAAFCNVCSLIIACLEDPEAGWTFIDSLYFVIVTFTTVGFGDMKSVVFERSSVSVYYWLAWVYAYVLMELGLVVMAAVITLLSENVQRNARRARIALERQCPGSTSE